MSSSFASWRTELRRSSSVVGADNPMRSALREAKSRRSSSNWRLSSSHDAICQPALTAQARTAIPTMSAIFFTRVRRYGPVRTPGSSRNSSATKEKIECNVPDSPTVLSPHKLGCTCVIRCRFTYKNKGAKNAAEGAGGDCDGRWAWDWARDRKEVCNGRRFGGGERAHGKGNRAGGAGNTECGLQSG